MSLTKNYFDAELEEMETTEEEGNAMYYYELERRFQLWISSLPNLTEAEKQDFLNLPESFWFSTSFEKWMQVQNESKEIELQLRRHLAVKPPHMSSVDPNQLEDLNVWSSIFSIDTEKNRMDLINRNSDL